jgi:Zn-dependent oligopeptidase
MSSKKVRKGKAKAKPKCKSFITMIEVSWALFDELKAVKLPGESWEQCLLRLAGYGREHLKDDLELKQSQVGRKGVGLMDQDKYDLSDWESEEAKSSILIANELAELNKTAKAILREIQKPLKKSGDVWNNG